MRKITAVVGLVTAIVVGMWSIGHFFDFEYPHWLTIRRAQVANAVTGATAGSLLAARFGDAKQRWHMCNYCRGWASSAGPYLHVEVVVAASPERRLHFAFDAARGVVVPMSVRTTAAVPEFVPVDEQVVRIGGSVGGDQFTLPASWLDRRGSQ